MGAWKWITAAGSAHEKQELWKGVCDSAVRSIRTKFVMAEKTSGELSSFPDDAISLFVFGQIGTSEVPAISKLLWT